MITRLAAMPGKTLTASLLVVALASAAGLSGCGSSGTEGEIPQSNAAQLNADLGAVRTSCEDGNAEGAASAASQFRDDVNSLPAPAGEDLKQKLRDAQDNLAQLVDQQCGAPSQGGGQSTTESSTAPTSTSTPSTTTTTTTTSTTDTTPPPGNGNGGDNTTGETTTSSDQTGGTGG